MTSPQQSQGKIRAPATPGRPAGIPGTTRQFRCHERPATGSWVQTRYAANRTPANPLTKPNRNPLTDLKPTRNPAGTRNPTRIQTGKPKRVKIKTPRCCFKMRAKHATRSAQECF